MKYKVIIFDIGDTLLENFPSPEQIYAERLRNIGIFVQDEMIKKIKYTINKISYEQIAKEEAGGPRISDEEFDLMLDKAVLLCINKKFDDIQLNEYIKKLQKETIPKIELRIIPNTIEVINLLVKNNYRLGIVSNHRKWMPEYLEQIGLAKYFERIIVSEIAGYEKPDVKIMQIALNELSIEPKYCLYVGDHPFDVLCSKKAGIDCAWLTEDDSVLPSSIPFKEDYKIKKLSDLIVILGLKELCK
jgi:HAD superfamily hydrolase (TIGR01549 family)